MSILADTLQTQNKSHIYVGHEAAPQDRHSVTHVIRWQCPDSKQPAALFVIPKLLVSPHLLERRNMTQTLQVRADS